MLLFVGLAFLFLFFFFFFSFERIFSYDKLWKRLQMFTEKNEAGDASARSAGLCPAPVLPGELQTSPGSGVSPASAAHGLGSTRQQASRQREGQGRAGTGSGAGGSSRCPEESEERGAAAGKGSQPSWHSLRSSAGLRLTPQTSVVPSVPSPAPCPLLSWGVQGQPRGFSWSEGSRGSCGAWGQAGAALGVPLPALADPWEHPS